MRWPRTRSVRRIGRPRRAPRRSRPRHWRGCRLPAALNGSVTTGLVSPLTTKGRGIAFTSSRFNLATRLVTCGEYLAFIDDGGYRRPELWLSDGWNVVDCTRLGGAAVLGTRRERWWSDDALGLPPVGGGRAGLPRELLRGRRLRPVGRCSLADRGGMGDRRPRLQPRAGTSSRGTLSSSAGPRPADELAQLFGDVWEWTQSPYTPYPGSRPAAGRTRRVQRQVHVQPACAEGRLVRDPGVAHPGDAIAISFPRMRAGSSPAFAWRRTS